MKSNQDIVCFGEILWDIFPNKKVIGGAPLNVALRLHSQGHSVGIISRLGDDDNGKKVLEYLKRESFPIEGIQIDGSLQTGEVLVSLNDQGSATYSITQPVAWDAIEYNSVTEELVKNAKVFLFGSLACRNKVSRDSLYKLIDTSNFSIFDVNLRPPFYSEELLILLLEKSNFVKVNDEELEEIANMLQCPLVGLEEKASWLIRKMNLKGICVTKGEKGAFLFLENEFCEHKGVKVSVEDTVGAGDSFLATLVGEIFINKTHPSMALERACAVGALVASKAGANCKLSENEVQNLIRTSKS